MNRFLSQRAGLVLTFSLFIVEPAALVLVPGTLHAQTNISGDIAGTVTRPFGRNSARRNRNRHRYSNWNGQGSQDRRRWSLSRVIAATWRLHPIRHRCRF